jgi:Uncharacterized protein conserved in bacteria
MLKKLLSNILVKNLLLMMILGMAIITGVMFWLDSYTMHNQAIVVPSLKGLQVEEAESMLKSKKLRFQVIDSVYSKDVVPGAIVEQIPDAESKVKENRIVFLTLNAKNAQTIELPNVLETSQRQAVASLRSLGFTVDSLRYVSYEYRDLVVEVLHNGMPVASGTRLPFGAKLVLEVGDGNMVMPIDSTNVEEFIEDADTNWFE